MMTEVNEIERLTVLDDGFSTLKNMPIYIYVSEHDKTICNIAAKKVYEKLPGPKEFFFQTNISH